MTFGSLAVTGTDVTINAGSVEGGDVTIQAGGFVRFDGALVDVTNLTITSGGSISDESGARLTVSGNTILTAGSITLDSPADHDFANLTTDTTSGPNGDQFIRELNGVAGLNLNAGIGTIELESGGPLTDTDPANDFTARNLILSVTAGGEIGTQANWIRTTS